MASVDGRRFSYNASGNADTFKCEPCANSGLVKEADKLCRQCAEYMCVSCSVIHKSFKELRNHTVVSYSALHSPERRDVGRHPLTSCPASTRTSFIDMKVATSADINIPDVFNTGFITGSTITPDGRLVIAHDGQQHIFLLDITFTIQSSLTLQDRPCDVAADGNNDVIVSMGCSKQLQWIHLDGDLRAGRTVTTSHPCYGVAVHSGHIYISVRTGTTSPYNGHVEVLTRDGSVVRRIGVDTSGAETCTFLRYITVDTSGTMYVTDWTRKGRIACFSSNGGKVYDVTHNDMRYPRGMVADDVGNLLVCSEGSHNVHLLAKDGSHNRILLTSADGLADPFTMAYRPSDGTLIVTLGDKPFFRAYKLKY